MARRNDGGGFRPGGLSPGSMPERPQSASSSRSWADIGVESDYELNSEHLSGPSPAPLWPEARSPGFAPRGYNEQKGHGLELLPRKNKLRNKAMTKEEALLAEQSSSSTVSRNSGSQELALTSGSQDLALQNLHAQGDDGVSTSGTSTIMSTADSSADISGDRALESVGSARHDTGMCTPCLFFYTNVGCHNGAECEFCHYQHKRKSKPRPCKGKRDRYRKLLMRMEQNARDVDKLNPDEDPDATTSESSGTPTVSSPWPTGVAESAATANSAKRGMSSTVVEI